MLWCWWNGIRPVRSLPAPSSPGHQVGSGTTWGRSSGTGEGAPDDGSGRETSLCESLCGVVCGGAVDRRQVAGKMSSLMSANVWLCSSSQAAIRSGSQISTRLSAPITTTSRSRPAYSLSSGGMRDPALLVGPVLGGPHRQEPAVLTRLADGERCLLDAVGHGREVGDREDVEAEVLTLRHHESLRELLPELGRQEEPVLLVELRGVGAHEHPGTSTSVDPSSTFRHHTPLCSTVNHIHPSRERVVQACGQPAVRMPRGGRRTPRRGASGRRIGAGQRAVASHRRHAGGRPGAGVGRSAGRAEPGAIAAAADGSAALEGVNPQPNRYPGSQNQAAPAA